MKYELGLDIVGNIRILIVHPVNGVCYRPLFVYRNEKIIDGLGIFRIVGKSPEFVEMDPVVTAEHLREIR